MTNPQNDPELGKYAIGSVDAITSKLQEISSLTVRSGLSSLKYLDTKKSPAELGKELKCNYLVIINISRLTNNMTMWVGLTRTKNNRQLWARPFDVNENQLMPLFTEIVQTMAGKLDIVLNNQEIINIEKDLTQEARCLFELSDGECRAYLSNGKHISRFNQFQIGNKLL